MLSAVQVGHSCRGCRGAAAASMSGLRCLTKTVQLCCDIEKGCNVINDCLSFSTSKRSRRHCPDLFLSVASVTDADC